MTRADSAFSSRTTLSNRPYFYSLFFLFIVAMHYYQPNGGGTGLSLAINNTVWIAISLFSAISLWRISKAGSIVYTRLELLALAVFVIFCLPLLWSQSPWRETAYDRYLVLGAIVFFLFCFRQFKLGEREEQYLLAIVSGASLIQSIIGLVQFFHADQWAIISGGRPPGTFQQVNVYASFLATGFAVSLYQLFKPVAGRWYLFHASVIFMVALLQALVLSRTGVIATILVLIGFAWLYKGKLKTLAIVVVLIVSGVLSALALQQLTVTEGRSLESAASPGYRTTLYKLSWELIKEEPLLGHGLGSFQFVFLEKQAKAYAHGLVDNTHNSQSSSHPHNELLYWWVEAGVVPVVIIILLAGCLTVIVWRQSIKHHKAYWLCLLPVAFHSQTEFPLYHSAVHLFLLVLFLSRFQFGQERYWTFSAPFLVRSLAIFLVTVVSVFTITNLHATYWMGQYYAQREPRSLLRVVNPFAQQTIYQFLLSDMFIRSKQYEALSRAEAMQRKAINVRPTDTAYKMLVDIAYTQGDIEKASQTHARASYLFPESGLFGQGKYVDKKQKK